MKDNLLKDLTFEIGEPEPTPFRNAIDIYQDGTVPFARDENGAWWAMSGHTHMGHIGIFKGTCLDDMKELYPIHTNFLTGGAGPAFATVKYPEGVKSRGSTWPFGLYIVPGTGRIICYFHNETGWNGHGTGYIIKGKGDGEPDFRHIGMMHSDDQGRTWEFDRWVLTSEEVCFSEYFNPDNVAVVGQPKGLTCLGAGDFSIYDNPKSDFIYLFYNLCRYESEEDTWKNCDVYVARTRRRTDGLLGDFVKYYDGAFCEAGNLGRETKIVDSLWHPRVTWFEKLGCYVLSGISVAPCKRLVTDVVELRTSHDMIHWSEPISLEYKGKPFGQHYGAIVPNTPGHPSVITGNDFSFLLCWNGSDVTRFRTTFH